MEGQDSYRVLYTENFKSLGEPIIPYTSGKCNPWSNHIVQMHSLLLCVTHFLFTADTKTLFT